MVQISAVKIFVSYVNEVIDYLQKCITSGEWEEFDFAETDNWILKLFNAELCRSVCEEDQLLIEMCRMWVAFGNAYIHKFKKRSKFMALDDIMVNCDDYFGFCMKRKTQKGSRFYVHRN